MYRAAVLIWHSKEERYVQPGESVNLDHLTPEQQAALVKQGVVESVDEKPARRGRAADGGNDGANN